MFDRLDEALARLAAASADRRLDGLEPEVWARINARTSPQAAPWPWAAAATAAALVIGVAVGGGAATRPSADRLAFSAGVALAPSTLLEGRR
jgi:hypothetical protein